MLLGKIFKLFIHSHFIIGLSAYCLSAEYFVLKGHAIYHPLCLFIGFSSILFYSIHRLFQVKKYANINSPRIIELKNHIQVYWITAVIAALFSAYYFFFNLIDLSIFIIPISIISGLYLFPVLKNKNRLRDIPFIKIFFISLGWSIITVLFPVFYLKEVVITIFNFTLILEKIFFIFLITLPFDIRDKLDDNAIGLKTVVTSIGASNSKRLGLFTFGLHSTSLLALWHFYYLPLHFILSYFICSVFGLIFLYRSDENRSNNYYSFWIDGLMAARLFLILIAIYINS